MVVKVPRVYLVVRGDAESQAVLAAFTREPPAVAYAKDLRIQLAEFYVELRKETPNDPKSLRALEASKERDEISVITCEPDQPRAKLPGAWEVRVDGEGDIEHRWYSMTSTPMSDPIHQVVEEEGTFYCYGYGTTEAEATSRAQGLYRSVKNGGD